MVANMEKIKIAFRALITFVGKIMSLRFPLWLFIVASLACVLFSLLVACAAQKANSVATTAAVGFSEYRGHNYIVFSANGSFSVVHDPECICTKID